VCWTQAKKDERDPRLAQGIAARQDSGVNTGIVIPAAVLGSVEAATIRSSPSEHAGAQFRVFPLDGHGLCGTVGGSEMSVAQSGATSRALRAECKSLLEELMFGGNGISSTWKSVPMGPVDQPDHTQRCVRWGNIAEEERARAMEAKA
jgi:hypothetical protein